MAKETLHFQVQSPENAVKLFCTILYERSSYMEEYGTVWHEAFEGEKGDKLFYGFMAELFPDGGRIAEPELKRLLSRAMRFLETDEECLELKAKHDKAAKRSYVYFAPLHRVYECGFLEHEKTVINILADYFGEAAETYDPGKFKDFIASSFEIKSANTSLERIVNDSAFIQRQTYFKAKRRKGFFDEAATPAFIE